MSSSASRPLDWLPSHSAIKHRRADLCRFRIDDTGKVPDSESLGASIVMTKHFHKKSRLVRHLMRLKRKTNYRHTCGRLIVKGEQLVTSLAEAINDDRIYFAQREGRLGENEGQLTGAESDRVCQIGLPFPFRMVLTSDRGLAERLRARRAARLIYVVERSLLEWICCTDSERETACVGEMTMPLPVEQFDSPRYLVAFDRVRYVHNLGLLLTNAAALGYDGLFFVDGTADPFNNRVLESSQATAFLMPYMKGTSGQLLDVCRQEQLLPLVAHVQGRPPQEIPIPPHYRGVCVILGNESAGPSELLLNNCAKVALPMSELMDSLNVGVAGGIIMHAFRTQYAEMFYKPPDN